MLDEAGGSLAALPVDRPERDRDVGVRLGIAGRESIDQPRRVKTIVIVEDQPDRYRRVGRYISIGFRLVDHDARGFVAETAHVVMHGFAVTESLGVLHWVPSSRTGSRCCRGLRSRSAWG